MGKLQGIAPVISQLGRQSSQEKRRKLFMVKEKVK